MADAALCCALEGRLLCGDGLERPRARRAHARSCARSTSTRERLDPARAHARRRARRSATAPCCWSRCRCRPSASARPRGRELTGAEDTRDVSAKFRLSLDPDRAGRRGRARITARSRNGDAARAGGPRPRRPPRLLLAARRARHPARPRATAGRELVLPEPPARDPRLDLRLPAPPRPRALRVGLRARRSRAPRGSRCCSRASRAPARRWPPRCSAPSSGSSSSASTSRRSSRSTSGRPRRTSTASSRPPTGSNAILFFDEADALFGKRSEVSDAHDRYANIEVAYLLQKMEGYPGAVILATNFRQNIDDAFVRRLDFVIDFPFPEAEDRKLIWRLLLPERGAARRRRRPRVPRDPVQALRRRDPQLLAGRRVPGRRRGDARSRCAT